MLPQSAERKSRKRGPRGNREATRERLLDAALTILKAHGAEALTTVSVTREASIVQSAFYHYFEDLDDCKRQAARRAADQIRALTNAWRRNVAQRERADTRLLAEDFEQIVTLFRTEGQVAQIFLRFRHDQSPLGDVMRQLVEELRDDYVRDLGEFTAKRGVTDAWRQRVAFNASLILAMVLDAGEALLSGRCTDVKLMAEELARSTSAIVDTLLAAGTSTPSTGRPRRKKRTRKRYSLGTGHTSSCLVRH